MDIEKQVGLMDDIKHTVSAWTEGLIPIQEALDKIRYIWNLLQKGINDD